MKFRLWTVFAVSLAALAFAGCSTPRQTIALGTPSLWLAEPCERTATRGIDMKFQFPAGEYRPVYRDAGGIYYRPDAQIIGPFSPAWFDTSDCCVYVKADGTSAIGGMTGVPNSLDRPLPFTAMPAANP